MTGEATYILDAEKVTKYYRRSSTLLAALGGTDERIPVVWDVSLRLKEGEILGIVGESGCGKTTLGKVLLGLIPRDGGTVKLDGVELDRLPWREQRRLRPKYQMLFQNPYTTLNPRMKVRDILAEAGGVIGLSGSELNERVDEALARVNLTGRAEAYPTQLSGGERRRVGLAKLLLTGPRLVIADEPVAGLDATIKARLVDLMLEVKAPEMAYIVISHDLNIIQYMSHRILVMYAGRVIEKLSVDMLSGDRSVLHPYTRELAEAAEALRLGGISREFAVREETVEYSYSQTGCRYRPRCPMVEEDGELSRLCSSTEPELVHVGDGHWVRCHLLERQLGKHSIAEG